MKRERFSRTRISGMLALAVVVAVSFVTCELKVFESSETEPDLGIRFQTAESELPPSEVVFWAVPAEWIERAMKGETDTGNFISEEQGDLSEGFSEIIDPSKLFIDEDWDAAVEAGRAAFEGVDLGDDPVEGDTVGVDLGLAGGEYHVYAFGFDVDDETGEIFAYAGTSLFGREYAERVFSGSGESEIGEEDILDPLVVGGGAPQTVTVEMVAQANPEYAIGDTGPAGGIIFYDDEADGTDDIAGARYLEAWTADEGQYAWKTSQTTTTGTSTAVGSGYENTYTEMTGTQHPAAEVVRNATHGGYTDWFLPSKDELNLMYQNLHQNNIGGFSTDFNYWSSSDNNNISATSQFFGNGDTQFPQKDDLELVRAIRAF